MSSRRRGGSVFLSNSRPTVLLNYKVGDAFAL